MSIVRIKSLLTLIMAAAIIGIVAEVVVEFVIQNVKWEGRIIIVVLFAMAVSFVYLAAIVNGILLELRSQHRAATNITTMIGLAEALRVYAKQGGSDQKYRLALHAAMREQYQHRLALHAAMREQYQHYQAVTGAATIDGATPDEG